VINDVLAVAIGAAIVLVIAVILGAPEQGLRAARAVRRQMGR
jgi:hypothetical protein